MVNWTKATRCWPYLLAAAIMTAASTGWAAGGAAASGDVGRGHALAEASCTRCHVIDQSGRSGWTNAPSFAAIANRPGTTMQSLEHTISQPHMKMVNLPRGPAETRQLAAYIMSLRQK